ncbi:MAG: hypothetical protein RIQ52_4 [Pseudomonadota bacterium]
MAKEDLWVAGLGDETVYRNNIPLLAVLLLPVVEMILLVYAGSLLGFALTFGLLCLSGSIGSWLLRARAPANWMELMLSVQQGRQLTAPELLEPMLTALAAVLLIIPGFISDVLAVVVLVPWLRQSLAQRLAGSGYWVSGVDGRESGRGVIEGEFHRD